LCNRRPAFVAAAQEGCVPAYVFATNEDPLYTKLTLEARGVARGTPFAARVSIRPFCERLLRVAAGGRSAARTRALPHPLLPHTC
jgi:hypothetical protein